MVPVLHFQLENRNFLLKNKVANITRTRFPCQENACILGSTFVAHVPIIILLVRRELSGDQGRPKILIHGFEGELINSLESILISVNFDR